jgi:hypothetical protein
MQFLVYLTVLMVSISTVLLEVHWLTSPAPRPKPEVQASSAPVSAPRAEGPNAALSPVYPKKPETKPMESAGAQSSQARQQPAASTIGTGSATPSVAVDNSANTHPPAAPSVPTDTSEKPSAAGPQLAQQPASQTHASAKPTHHAPVETTGVAAREDDARPPGSAVTSPSSHNSQEAVAAPTTNRCDVQACSNAYKSFRASDCTYQSFDGPRRACTKPPVQRTVRAQSEEPARRKWIRDEDPRYFGRSRVNRSADDDDEGPAAADTIDDSDREVLIIPRIGPRW